MPKVVCVTGANKGIGFEIVRLLCQKLKPAGDFEVLLTARSSEHGEKAVQTLKGEKLPITPIFKQLDIRNKKQCDDFRDHIKEEYGGLDMLVNNAAIAYKVASTAPPEEQMRETLLTNYFGTKQVTEALLPVLRDNARVIVVGSSMAATGFRDLGPPVRERLLAADLTIQELDQLMQKCIDDAAALKLKQPVSAYGISKKCSDHCCVGRSFFFSCLMTVTQAAVIAYTRVCAQRAKEEGGLPGLHAKNVYFACCHPGWCKTDMAGWERPPQSAADGAAAVVDVCLNGTEEMNGKYVENGKVATPWIQ